MAAKLPYLDITKDGEVGKAQRIMLVNFSRRSEQGEKK